MSMIPTVRFDRTTSRTLTTPVLAGLLLGLGIGATTDANPLWLPSGKIYATSPAAGEFMGDALVMNEDFIVSGAVIGWVNGLRTGSTYVFDRATRTQLFELAAPGAQMDDRSGEALALDGDLLLVGSPYVDHDGDNAGAAHLFNARTGAYLRTFRGDDTIAGDEMGWAVALDGNYAVVGAHLHFNSFQYGGAAYVFDVQTGRQLHKLVPSDPQFDGHFGLSVGVDAQNNIVIVGAPRTRNPESGGGTAYVFDLTTGEQRYTLHGNASRDGDLYAYEVVVKDNIAMIGAMNDDEFGRDAGAVYMYNLADGSLIHKFVSDDIRSFDNFGATFDFDGATAIIGAENESNRTILDGAAYIFDLATFTQVAELRSAEPEAFEFFGAGVAVEGDTIVVAAPQDSEFWMDAGSLFVFSRYDGGNFSITANGTCPGEVTISVAGAVPGGPVALVYGVNTGPFTVPSGPCAGLELGLRPPFLSGSPARTTADATGAATFRSRVPANVCGSLRVQAVDATTCTASEVISVQ